MYKTKITFTVILHKIISSRKCIAPRGIFGWGKIKRTRNIKVLKVALTSSIP